MKKDVLDLDEIQGGYYKEDLVPVKLAYLLVGIVLGFLSGLVAVIIYLK